MKAGILAAGTGSRFLQAGWDEPKPLVRLGGRPIIHHVLDNLFQAGVESVEVLLNGHERFDPVEDYLQGLPEAEQRIRVSRKITRSSFETFSCLLKQMGPPPFVLSTVDSILDRGDLERFLQPESYPPECALALAVTDYVNDEKPLWVEFDPTGKISCIGEGVSEKKFVTAGIYFVLKDLAETAVGEDFEALRFFLGHVLRSGKPVWAREFRMALDIDDPGDIQAGEQILKTKAGGAFREIPL
jgi:NDP-sugar pyrophosphorylase family protein